MDPGAAAKSFGPAADPSTWKSSHAARPVGPSKLLCPADGGVLDAYRLKFDGDSVEVDSCPRCHGVWLDAHEGPKLASIVYHAEGYAHRRREGIERPGGRGEGAIIAYVLQVISQFPVEAWNPVRRTPWVVYSLLVVLTGLFMVQMVYAEWFFATDYEKAMFVPRDFLAGENLWTVITAGFLHADPIHLLGNMYFLYVFGDNVEDTLGRLKFLLIYFVALVIGNLTHLAVFPDSDTPLLGASGATSGLMGAYLALFPRVKVWFMLVVIRFRASVFWFIALWVGLQVVMWLRGSEGVAWFAHFGGLAAGIALGLALRPRTQAALTAEHRV